MHKKRYSIGGESDNFVIEKIDKSDKNENRESKIRPSYKLLSKKTQLTNLNKEILLKSIALNYL